MKSTCKKFLAMFLAVFFVMGTMVTSTSAVEECTCFHKLDIYYYTNYFP